LSFSRKAKQEKRLLDISSVVKESLRLIRSSTPSSIVIREHIPETIDAVSADATQIHQILINLCTNASHAMSDGGILEVTLRPLDPADKIDQELRQLPHDSYIVLIVKDTGTGIDSKILDKIFDPYFTTKEVGKGTGMGLAVVHGIVKNHEGEIFVKSEIGKGTVFTIVFPVVGKLSVQETDRKTDHSVKNHGSETILFVDDETSIVKLSEKALKKLGYSVHTAANPLKALDIFKSDPDSFDLVISDMTMPQMNGLKLSEKLREIKSDIPIIICTGHGSAIDIKQASDLLISDFVDKPITISELARVIRRVLDSKKQRKAL
jgi:CheY-like chemotaxis protein/two-component sensor histidine kinase